MKSAGSQPERLDFTVDLSAVRFTFPADVLGDASPIRVDPSPGSDDRTVAENRILPDGPVLVDFKREVHVFVERPAGSKVRTGADLK